MEQPLVPVVILCALFGAAVVARLFRPGPSSPASAPPPWADQDVEAKTAILAALDRSRTIVTADHPFQLLKSESLVWAAPAVYGKTGREYRAGSQGASFRVAKGVSFRVGGTRGRTVDTPIQFKHPGVFGVTTKHLYFAADDPHHGPSFRVRLDRIVTTTPFQDGLSFMRDNASAKPEGFMHLDGVFLQAVLDKLADLLAADARISPMTPAETNEWEGEAATAHHALGA